MERNEREKDGCLLELIQYTDPYCTWCWGSEPVMRRIEEIYGSQVHIRYIMGGLVEDTEKFYDPLNRIGGAEMYKQVAVHWEEAAQRHKMPVDASVFTDMKQEFRSTYPACVAFKAAELQDAELAKKYLRRLREATAVEHRFIHRVEVQAELAEEVGLDQERFLADIDSGRAEAEFRKDLAICREEQVSGFPSFAIRRVSDGETLRFDFYMSSMALEEQFRRLAGDSLVARELSPSEENILAFVNKYGAVAAREVGELFMIALGDAREKLDNLVDQGKLKWRRAGNGVFYQPA
ncbi:MAG: DsbA family protein [Thermoleophilia bacterium]